MAWVSLMRRDRAGQCGAWRGAWAGGGDRRHHRGGAWRDLRHAAAVRVAGQCPRAAPDHPAAPRLAEVEAMLSGAFGGGPGSAALTTGRGWRVAGAGSTWPAPED